MELELMEAAQAVQVLTNSLTSSVPFQTVLRPTLPSVLSVQVGLFLVPSEAA